MTESSHLFRVYSTFNTEDNGDRQETAHFRAKDIEQVIEFIKKEFFNKKVQNDLNIDYCAGDTAIIDYNYAVDENGKQLTQAQIDKLDEDEINWCSEGYEVNQDDNIEENFHTIYGGNDFYDLTKPKDKQHGITSADQAKKYGSAEKAFFKAGSGQGFESGNENNDYNLNTHNIKLYNPKKEKEV